MTPTQERDRGFPAVGSLTGQEREGIENADQSRDILRRVWIEANASLIGCTERRDHHHHDPRSIEKPVCRCAVGPDETAVECPGPGLTHLVGSREYTEPGLPLSLNSRGLWFRVYEVETDDDGNEYEVEDEEQATWVSPSDAPLAMLRTLASELGPFVGRARAHLLGQATKEAEENAKAAELVRATVRKGAV